MSEEDIREAEYQCGARNTCFYNVPVGGEGSLVETPIPDNPMIHTLYARVNKGIHGMICQ